MPVPPVGTRISREVLLDADAVRTGARFAGDFNPLHHDPDFAAATRYGGLIASGAHTSALLAGLVSEMVTEAGADPAVGMDYRVRFVRPVPIGRRIRLEWTISRFESARSGQIGHLKGQITDAEDGRPLLTADMRCLFFA